MNNLLCPLCSDTDSDKFEKQPSVKQAKLKTFPPAKGVFLCEKCRGYWYDWKDFPQNRLSSGEIYLEKNLNSLKQTELKKKADKNTKNLLCPHCKQTLKKSDFLGRSGLELYSCPEHGLFFPEESKELLLEISRYWQEAPETEDSTKTDESANLKNALQLMLSFVGGKEMLI